jgi:YD repeat-containing protein
LRASAQDDGQDSTPTLTRWVVGAGGIFDANNSDGDTLSATFGQTAIDSAAVEDSSYGKIIYQPSAGWVYPRTVANLGFWLPKPAPPGEAQFTSASAELSGAFALTNTPNPFASSTTISYLLPAAGHIRLRIHNAAGDQVRLLTDETEPAGAHQVDWDGDGEKGERLASGSYYCTLELLSNAVVQSPETIDRRMIYLAK